MKFHALFSLAAAALQVVTMPFTLEQAVVPGSPPNLVGISAVVVTTNVGRQGLPANIHVVYGVPPVSNVAVASVTSWRFRNETGTERPVSATFLFRQAVIYSAQPIQFPALVSDGSLPREVPPLPRLAVDPGYPANSIAEGAAVVEVDVDVTGTPRQIREIGPPSQFGQFTLSAVREWRFFPALRNGRAVEGTAIVVITFPRPVTE